MKPVFQDLASEDLLKRCLHGGTQNQNESFNNLVWTYIPKNTFVGHSVLEVGVYEAILSYNGGFQACTDVLSRLGIPLSYDCKTASVRIDERRVSEADRVQKAKKSNKRAKEMDDGCDADYGYGRF